MKELFNLEERKKSIAEYLCTKYGIKSIDVTPLRVHASTDTAYATLWYDSKPEKIEIKKTCSDNQPETVDEFEAFQKQFKADSKKLKKVINDWWELINED